ncbi:MAG: bacteriohemerythrin [Methylomonas sp.]|nr:bacteriohemerythrin [Methylomonas sp.]
MNKPRNNIIWPESMRTGVDCMDEQHQTLADMIRLADARLQDNSSRDIDAVILDLLSYALYHFDTEEELMRRYDYHFAEREKHCREHRRFSAAITQYQQEINQGQSVSGSELLGFVREWLTLHILITDKRLGKFLSGKIETSHD